MFHDVPVLDIEVQVKYVDQACKNDSPYISEYYILYRLYTYNVYMWATKFLQISSHFFGGRKGEHSKHEEHRCLGSLAKKDRRLPG